MHHSYMSLMQKLIYDQNVSTWLLNNKLYLFMKIMEQKQYGENGNAKNGVKTVT